jgi:hypothetical protein
MADSFEFVCAQTNAVFREEKAKILNLWASKDTFLQLNF